MKKITLFLLCISIFIACKKEDSKVDNSTPVIEELMEDEEALIIDDRPFYFSLLLTDDINVDEYKIQVKDEFQTVIWDTLIDTNNDTVLIEHRFEGNQFGEGNFSIEAIAEDDADNRSISSPRNFRVAKKGSIQEMLDIMPPFFDLLENAEGEFQISSNGDYYVFYSAAIEIMLTYKNEIQDLEIAMVPKNSRGDFGPTIAYAEFNSQTPRNNDFWDNTLGNGNYQIRTQSTNQRRFMKSSSFYTTVRDFYNGNKFNGEIRITCKTNDGDFSYRQTLNLNGSRNGNSVKFQL